MLRLLESAHRGAVLIPVSINVAASGVTFNYGKSLFSSAVRNGAGDYTLTLKNPLSRQGTVIGAVYATGGAGYRANATMVSTSAINVLTKDASNSAVESIAVDFIVAGFIQNEYDKYSGKLFEVKAPMLSPRLVFGQFSSVPAATIGAGDFTATKTSTGTYSIVFRRPFAQLPIILPMGYDDGTVTSVSIKSKTAASCVLEVYDHTGNALADGAFSLFVMGSQGVGECGWNNFRQVLTTQRNCRLLLLSRATLGSGTMIVGGGDYGGDFSASVNSGAAAIINITDSFARACVFVGTGLTQIARRSSGNSGAAQFGIRTADTDGNAANDGVNAIVIGSDDATEYFSAS